MTGAWRLSIESSAPCSVSRHARNRSKTGATRRSSGFASTGSAPGRVDSPPMSKIAAPASARCLQCATAAPGSSASPASEKLSGVTLTMPMSRGRVSVSIPGRLREPDKLSKRARVRVRGPSSRLSAQASISPSGAKAADTRSGSRISTSQAEKASPPPASGRAKPRSSAAAAAEPLSRRTGRRYGRAPAGSFAGR